MILAKSQQVIVSSRPEIIQFMISSGALVCLFHPKSGVGGGVAVPESAAASASSLVESLLREVLQVSGGDGSEVEIKLAGAGPSLIALRNAAAALQVRVRGEHQATETELRAFFYTDSGRLRVQLATDAETAPPHLKTHPPKSVSRTRVLIVDDSKSVRHVLSHILSADPELEVVGTLESPTLLEQRIEELRPDVITLDIHMPEIDGVTLLERILPKHPLPVVMISSISMEEGSQVLRALELGAVDYIQKPSFNELDAVGPVIAERVKAAAFAKVRRKAGLLTPAGNRLGSDGVLDTSTVVAMGASTGGTEALKQIFCRLPADIPPILVVQHIPAVFSTAFAKRLNELCPFEVKEAQDGDLIQPGRILIAPGGLHMSVRGKKAPFRIRVSEEGPVLRHKPSVDELFNSVAECVGRDSIGILLTGMGTDGAKGLLKMKEAGARTIAQDEASSAVFGMPREAIKIGAAESVHALDDIPEALIKLLRRRQVA